MRIKNESTEPINMGIDSFNAQLLTKIMSSAQTIIKKMWNDLNDINQ